MAIYNMAQVESLTGIKSHTLRVWEKRYSLINPSRTDTNIRYYSDYQLKKLLNISMLLKKGYKISKIDKLTDEEFNSVVLDVCSNYAVEYENDINRLSLAMIEMNEKLFEEVYESNVMNNGLLSTFTNLVYPFLNHVGLLWTTHKSIPSQEHFVSNLIRQKLIAAIDSINVSTKNSKKIILFLSENESHEIGLLLSYFLAKRMGWQVYYLGQNVPLDNLFEVNEIANASVIFTIFTAPKKEKYFEDFLNFAEKMDSAVLVSGYQIKEHLNSNLHYIGSPQDFMDFLKNISLKEVV